MRKSMRDDIENFRVTRLPRHGPDAGQSTEAWLKVKAKDEEHLQTKREKDLTKHRKNLK